MLAARARVAVRRSTAGAVRRCATQTAAEAEAATAAAAAKRKKWRNRIIAAVLLPPVAAPLVFLGAIKYSPEFRAELRASYPGQMDELLDSVEFVELETEEEKEERLAPPPFDDDELLTALVVTNGGQSLRIEGVLATDSLAAVRAKVKEQTGIDQGIAKLDFEDSAVRDVDREYAAFTAMAAFAPQAGSPEAAQAQGEPQDQGEPVPQSTWPKERPQRETKKVLAEAVGVGSLEQLRAREKQLLHERATGAREIDVIDADLAAVRAQKADAKRSAPPSARGGWFR